MYVCVRLRCGISIKNRTAHYLLHDLACNCEQRCWRLPHNPTGALAVPCPDLLVLHRSPIPLLATVPCDPAPRCHSSLVLSSSAGSWRTWCWCCAVRSSLRPACRRGDLGLTAGLMGRHADAAVMVRWLIGTRTCRDGVCMLGAAGKQVRELEGNLSD